MAMKYEELNEKTREYMLAEFEKEQASESAYRSKALSQKGLDVFPNLMREAIISGTEVSLCESIESDPYWTSTEKYTRGGVTRMRRRNIAQSARRLALTEFSTWYVRGFARRLLDEGVEQCEVYRGEQPKWEPAECATHEGSIVSVRGIYDNHRARYCPEPGDQTAFSIPFGPGCHHVIRRV